MMRPLTALAAALVLIDSLLYAALTPLLPHLLHEFGLSKSKAGILVAAYAAGALAGGLVGGLAATHVGSRQAVLAGLATMGLSSVGFAFAHSFGTLLVARLLQGLASGFTWSGALAWLLAVAPRERRGEVLGTALGAATAGAMLGPVVGAVSALAGRDVVFSVLAGSSLVLGVWALQFEPAAADQPSYAAIGRALRNRAFLIGLMLMTLGALLFGILGVLAPLRLAHAGWGAAAIGGVWLASTAVGTLQAPLVGRASRSRPAVFCRLRSPPERGRSHTPPGHPRRAIRCRPLQHRIHASRRRGRTCGAGTRNGVRTHERSLGRRRSGRPSGRGHNRVGNRRLDPVRSCRRALLRLADRRRSAGIASGPRPDVSHRRERMTEAHKARRRIMRSIARWSR